MGSGIIRVVLLCAAVLFAAASANNHGSTHTTTPATTTPAPPAVYVPNEPNGAPPGSGGWFCEFTKITVPGTPGDSEEEATSDMQSVTSSCWRAQADCAATAEGVRRQFQEDSDTGKGVDMKNVNISQCYQRETAACQEVQKPDGSWVWYCVADLEECQKDVSSNGKTTSCKVFP
jgi:hypothetical protein